MNKCVCSASLKGNWYSKIIEFVVEKRFMHHPILSPIAHPDEDKKILENMVGQELICDDNSHR